MLFTSGRKRRVDPHLVCLVERNSFETNQYRRLCHRVEELRTSRDLRVFAVTSAVAGEGKTLTAINLAAVLARGRRNRVLLIDGDLRRPSIARYLGMAITRGGFDGALDAAGKPLAAFVEKLTRPDLAVVPCSPRGADAYDLVTSPRFAELIAEARRSYDHVIVDTPPVIPVPDAQLVHRMVDGYVFVVAANATPRRVVGEALDLLHPGSVAGMILNRDANPVRGYYGGYDS